MEVLSLLTAYLLGSIPFAYLLVRAVRGKDIRSIGSGNVGATNAMRAAGRLGGVLTLVLDAGKGWAAVFLTRAWTHSESWAVAAALMAIVGHIFPVFLGFRGGKGVATAAGAFLAVAPWVMAGAAAVFLLVVAVTRYVSLGSVCAAASFPVLAYVQGLGLPAVPAGMLCAALIIWKHSANIQRLRQGTEPRLIH